MLNKISPRLATNEGDFICVVLFNNNCSLSHYTHSNIHFALLALGGKNLGTVFRQDILRFGYNLDFLSEQYRCLPHRCSKLHNLHMSFEFCTHRYKHCLYNTLCHMDLFHRWPHNCFRSTYNHSRSYQACTLYFQLSNLSFGPYSLSNYHDLGKCLNHILNSYWLYIPSYSCCRPWYSRCRKPNLNILTNMYCNKMYNERLPAPLPYRCHIITWINFRTT